MFLQRFLSKQRIAFVVWTALAAFLTYASMYAFRKPLSAGVFEGFVLWGVSYKVLLVIAQVLGYLTAKFIGIKVIAELEKGRRFWLLIALILTAEAALLGFGLSAYPYGLIWVFFNGLPLGLIWGIVFSYIEGRRFTDVLATFLSISFIVSSGVVKTIGRIMVEQWGISEFWMPALVGACFFPLLFLAAWMLELAPEPDAEDIAQRTERLPMTPQERKALFKQFSFGLSAILLVNFAMTIGRDIKDNFLVEIWGQLDPNASAYVFTQVETGVAIVVLFLLSLLVLVRNNRRAFAILHSSMAIGFLLVLCSTLAFGRGHLDPKVWMALHGIGLYLAYIAFQSLYFERFIATFRVKGNVGFLIYLSDFIGYLGSCGVLIAKELVGLSLDWSRFFIGLTYVVVVVGLVGVVAAHIYFAWRSATLASEHSPQ
jgi:MFS family permease